MRLTSNLDRNSSMAALSPDKNWGCVDILLRVSVDVKDEDREKRVCKTSYKSGAAAEH